MTEPDAYFVPLGEGRYRATGHTVGPWAPTDQHGGPPAALLAREMSRAFPRHGASFARLTFDLLGPIPVGEVELEATLPRPGRSVELLEATMRADGREVIRARGWRVLGARGPTIGDEYASPPLPPDASEVPGLTGRAGCLGSMEWLYAGGALAVIGEARVWAWVEGSVFAVVASV